MIKLLLSALILISAVFSSAQADTTKVSIQHNNLTLLANHQIGEDADPWKKVILILHGTLGHKDMEIISSQQAILAERGFSSLALNLSYNVTKRSAMYDCAQAHTHKHTDALIELGLWVADLKKRGTEEIWLMGHSRGSNQVAWFLSKHDEDSLKGLILIAPPAEDPKEYEQIFKKDGKDLKVLLTAARKMEKGSMITASSFLHCTDANVSAAAFVDYYQNDQRHDTTTLLKTISKPVLIVAGSEDRVVPNLPTKAEALSAAKDNITYIVVDGADHFFQDLYGEDIADGVETLINGE